MFALLVIISIAGTVHAQFADDAVRNLFGEKIGECIGFGFYEQMGYSVPNENDLSAFEEFSKVYHSVASHNSDFNAGNARYTQEVNCFATVSSKSLQATFVLMTPEPNQDEMIGSSLGESPEEYDRRDDNTTTPARNQGSCGSCWAFSGIAALESRYLDLTGEAPESVDFSEQQFLDCTYEATAGQDGCSGGWMTKTWIRLRSQEHSILYNETQRAYTKTDAKCDIIEQNLPNAMSKVVMKYPSYKQVGDSSTAKTMGASTQEQIYSEGAVSIAIQSETSFTSYSSGIFDTQCIGSSVNHALTLIGYTQEYFIAQNSWGIWWGEDGTVRLSRTSGNLCQMLSYTMWPLMECAWGTDEETGKCVAEEPCGGCENNGRCSQTPERSDVWHCDCLDGYTGDMCQTEEGDECKVPCSKYGTCNSTTGQCDCEEGWTGDMCDQEEKNECEGIVCKNGGKCDPSTGGCKCQTGYTGEYCEDKTDTTCDKKCRGYKSECYWKTISSAERFMKCKCPGMTYGKQCREELDCDTATDIKHCQKKKDKNEDAFKAKCQKVWGMKKCPVSCGFCPEAANPSVILLPPLEFTNDS